MPAITRSSIAGLATAPITVPVTASAYPSAGTSSRATVEPAPDVNVLAGRDAVQNAVEGDLEVATCDPGKETAQNETTIAVDAADPSVLVAGANDYRLFSPAARRYDASGGVYRSTDGGKTWTVSLLPGLVSMNADAPGPYQVAGDPAVVAGPPGVFWYANVAFNRDGTRSAVAVSRSTDSATTWTTNTVIASEGAAIHDKEWIASDPAEANTAYVTWTLFPAGAAPAGIWISKTVDGGRRWSPPRPVSPFPLAQNSIVTLQRLGPVPVVHVVYFALTPLPSVVHSMSFDGAMTFVTRVVARVDPIQLAGASFRYNSYPSLALDGGTLHVVWANWSGSSADIVYVRSSDGGLVWTSPVTISPAAGDQFFPWVAARDGRVFAGWYDRRTRDERFTYVVAGSSDAGATWSEQVTVSSAVSDASAANRFGPPRCASFIGDYTGVAVGPDGTGHAIWTDARQGNDGNGGADLDPYVAAVRLS